MMLNQIMGAGKGIAVGGQIALIFVGLLALAAIVFVLLRVSANFKNHYTVEFVEQKSQKVYVCGGKIDLTDEEMAGIFAKYEAQTGKADHVDKKQLARERIAVCLQYNADRSAANFYVGRAGRFEKAQELEIPAGTYVKLTVAKPSRVKEALRALLCFETQRDYLCDYRQFREDGSVEIYVSLFVPKTAGEHVAVAGGEKSVADWVELEREKLEDVLDQDKDPMAYIDAELAKKQSPIARKLALKSVKQDLLKLTADLEEELKAKPIVENRTDDVMLSSSADPLAARAAFVAAQKAGKDPTVFPQVCRITKEDAIDYLNQHMVGDKYPQKTSCKRSKNDFSPDYLKCGDRAFAVLTEQRKVLKLVLRLSKSDAEAIEKLHSGFSKSALFKSSEWFDAVIDPSYLSKQEVFDLLDRAYAYTLNHTYTFDNTTKRYATNAENALAEATLIDSVIEVNLLDSAFEKAVTQQKQAYAEYLKHYKNNAFTVSRARLLDHMEKANLPDLSCIRRVPYRPFSLKYKNKTFAMVYENMGAVKLVLKAEESYIRTLEKQHPITFKARFPRGKNWYVVMLDPSYPTLNACLSVLTISYNFLVGKTE